MDTDEAFNAALDRLAAQMNEPGVQEWLAIRKQAGQKLDPETAVLISWYGQIADSYGVCADFPEELDCVGRVIFARSPESDIWVDFSDLPEATVVRLRERIEAGDFDKSDTDQQERDRVAPLTFEQARKEVQVALGLHLDTTDMMIEECSQLPDGRFQFIISEHRPGRIEAP
jgi:hypothetical protein